MTNSCEILKQSWQVYDGLNVLRVRACLCIRKHFYGFFMSWCCQESFKGSVESLKVLFWCICILNDIIQIYDDFVNSSPLKCVSLVSQMLQENLSIQRAFV